MTEKYKLDRQLGVGVIGLGGIAHFHAPGWLLSPYTKLVAGSDIKPEIFAVWQDRFGTSRFYEDPADLISDPDIDIVDICSPNIFHAEQTIAALRAGKYVLCEKPLSIKPDDIRNMIAARDSSGKLLMTAQHFRFQSISQAMKSKIKEGVLGDVYHARAWMLRRCQLPSSPTFIRKDQSGGGPAIDLGTHILDLTLWMMDFPRPTAVNGVAKTALAKHKGAFTNWAGRNLIPQDIEVEDFAAALVHFDNGATLILEVSWLLHHDTPECDMRVWLYGTEGGCEWPAANFLTNDYAARQLYNNSIQTADDVTEPHAVECMEFARAIVHGLPSPVPAEQSLHVQTILDGIYLSQSEGREIRLGGKI